MRCLLIYLSVGIITCLSGIFGTYYLLMPVIPETEEVAAPKVEIYITDPAAEHRLLTSPAYLINNFSFKRIAEANLLTVDNHYRHTQTWKYDNGEQIFCVSDVYWTIKEAQNQFRQTIVKSIRTIEKEQSNKDNHGQIYFEALVGMFSSEEQTHRRYFFRITRVDEQVTICSSSSLQHLLNFENNYIN